MALPAKAEPVFIVCAMVITGLTATQWPTEVTVGRFVLWLSVIFLLQTLVRDLYLYFRIKNKTLEQKEAQCFCVESGVGILVLVMGLALLTVNAGGSVAPGAIGWFVSISVCLWLNFWMKDFVFSWNPWRIYRDPDHLNIVPRIRVKRS